MLTQRIFECFSLSCGRPPAECNNSSARRRDGRASPAHPLTTRGLLTFAGEACWAFLAASPPLSSTAIYALCSRQTSRTGLLGYCTVRWAQQSVFSTGKSSAAHTCSAAVSPQAADQFRTRQADSASRRWIYDCAPGCYRSPPNPTCPRPRTPFHLSGNPYSSVVCFESRSSHCQQEAHPGLTRLTLRPWDVARWAPERKRGVLALELAMQQKTGGTLSRR